tara:strand:- start:94 stop:276 length:183 start_codon:yes stop_codon:yes gene_type:complete
LGEASVKDMLTHQPNPPGYSATRATVNKLAAKGPLVRREQNLKYAYYLPADHQEARESAL